MILTVCLLINLLTIVIVLALGLAIRKQFL